MIEGSLATEILRLSASILRRRLQANTLQNRGVTMMTSGQLPLKSVTKELAELTRDLHQLLLSYAPTWYKEGMDDRVRKVLGVADSTLHSLRQPRQK